MKQQIIKILTRLFLIIIAIAVILYIKGLTIAADPPHDNNDPNTNYRVYCNHCHQVHKAPGPSLTNAASNANVCLSTCHYSTGVASGKPFADADQADLGASPTEGSSHRWDVSIQAGTWITSAKSALILGDSNNPYGLRPAAAIWTAPAAGEVQSLALNTQLRKFRNVITCSVCHQQHGQAATTWNPYAGLGGGENTLQATCESLCSTTVIEDTGRAWTANQWANYYVRIRSGNNLGSVRKIIGNTATTLTVSTPWSTTISAGDTYEIVGRHFQRISTSLWSTLSNINDMCEDCHYYRTYLWTTNVRTWTSNYQSHPVQRIFTGDPGRDVLDTLQFNNAPLEPASANWQPQTGNRYHLDGSNDNNYTNNIVVDSGKRTRCLSCHGIHYTDSDSSTEDR